MTRTRRFRPLLAITLGALVLQACTLDMEVEPTATAAPTAIVFEPGDVAVGDLIDDSRAAWQGVEAWTSETRIDSPDSAEGVGTSSAVSERIVLPDSRHVMSMNGETVVTEEIVVDGRIYMRGTLVSSSIYPDVDAETWISFTPEQAPEDSVLAQRVEYLTTAPGFPFETVTHQTRALPASPAGETQVDGRACRVYQFTTASDAAEGIEHRIAFDDENRPCQLIREGGGVVETTTWSYPSDPEPITAPKDAVQVDTFPTGGA